MTSSPPMLAWGTAQGGLPAFRDMSGAWKIFHGIPIDEQEYAYRTIVDFGRAPADEGWVYACVMRRAAYAQSVPWRGYVREAKALVPAGGANDPAGPGPPGHDAQEGAHLDRLLRVPPQRTDARYRNLRAQGYRRLPAHQPERPAARTFPSLGGSGAHQRQPHDRRSDERDPA